MKKILFLTFVVGAFATQACVYKRTTVKTKVAKDSVIVATFNKDGDGVRVKNNEINQRVARVLMEGGYTVKGLNVIDANLLVPSLGNSLKRIRFKGDLKEFISAATKTDYEYERQLRGQLKAVSQDLGAKSLIVLTIDEGELASFSYEIFAIDLDSYSVVAQRTHIDRTDRYLRFSGLGNIVVGIRNMIFPFYYEQRIEREVAEFAAEVAGS